MGSDRVKTVREASEIDPALAEALGAVAHDLNNLMNVVIGRSERVRRAVGDASPLAAELADIIAAGERAVELVRRLDVLRGARDVSSAAAERVTPAPAQSAETPAPGAEREVVVLLVEDQRDLRGALRDVLRDESFRVLEAAGAEEALRVAQGVGGRIDVLLSDMVMPTMSGRELAERMLATRPELRVVLMSGYAAEVELREAAGSERMVFLAKPFRPEQLVDAIRALLASGDAPSRKARGRG